MGVMNYVGVLVELGQPGDTPRRITHTYRGVTLNQVRDGLSQMRPSDSKPLARMIVRVDRDGSEVVDIGGAVRPTGVWDMIERIVLRLLEALIESIKGEIRDAEGKPDPLDRDEPGAESPAERIRRAKRMAEREAAEVYAAASVETRNDPRAGGEPLAYTQEFRRHEATGVTFGSEGGTKSQIVMGFAEAWEVTAGRGVLIGVLDTGCRETHPAFYGRDIVVIDCTGTGGHESDTNGHGTFVSSQIVSQMPPAKFRGGAYGADLVVAGVLHATYGYGADSWIARGVRALVMAGCKVISGSLGGPENLPLTAQAVKDAIAAGVTFCFAAGNSAATRRGLDYPGRLPGVIAVGSCSINGLKSVFSQTGSELAVYAHGEGQIGATGRDGYQQWDGTSMATPHVASAVALMIAAAAELSPDPIPPHHMLNYVIDGAQQREKSPSAPDGFVGVLHAAQMLMLLPSPKPTDPEPTDPDVVEIHYRWSESGRHQWDVFRQIAELFTTHHTVTVKLIDDTPIGNTFAD